MKGSHTAHDCGHRVPLIEVHATGAEDQRNASERTEDEVVVRLDLPGVDPSAIDITVEKHDLVIEATRTWTPAEDSQVLAAERPHGSFRRQLSLGDQLDAEQVEASYDAGVLALRIPVAEQAKPRKVDVAIGGTAAAIDTTATDAD